MILNKFEQIYKSNKRYLFVQSQQWKQVYMKSHQKLTIKRQERLHWCHSRVLNDNFCVNFKHCSSVSIVEFEQVNASQLSSIYPKLTIKKLNYLLIVNDRITIKRCEISSKLTVKTRVLPQWRCLVFLLLTLSIFHTFF